MGGNRFNKELKKAQLVNEKQDVLKTMENLKPTVKEYGKRFKKRRELIKQFENKYEKELKLGTIKRRDLIKVVDNRLANNFKIAKSDYAKLRAKVTAKYDKAIKEGKSVNLNNIELKELNYKISTSKLDKLEDFINKPSTGNSMMKSMGKKGSLGKQIHKPKVSTKSSRKTSEPRPQVEETKLSDLLGTSLKGGEKLKYNPFSSRNNAIVNEVFGKSNIVGEVSIKTGKSKISNVGLASKTQVKDKLKEELKKDKQPLKERVYEKERLKEIDKLKELEKLRETSQEQLRKQGLKQRQLQRLKAVNQPVARTLPKTTPKLTTLKFKYIDMLRFDPIKGRDFDIDWDEVKKKKRKKKAKKSRVKGRDFVQDPTQRWSGDSKNSFVMNRLMKKRYGNLYL